MNANTNNTDIEPKMSNDTIVVITSEADGYWIQLIRHCGCGQVIKVFSPMPDGAMKMQCGKCGKKLKITIKEDV